tara:strand:- start:28191 stop:28454 length:264 start_codon:yes stop_codon:yes gene_type:complete
MSNSADRERDLAIALNDVMLAASSFAYGRGMPEARKHLQAAIQQGNAVLNQKPCARDQQHVPDLRELADQADAAMAEQPGFRRDTHG